MGNFRRDNSSSSRFGGDRGGGRRSFGGGGGGRSFSRSDDRPREMFKTVCSNCGKDCEVPFRPTTGKPVYCSDCFEKVGGRNSDGGRPERSDRPNFDRPLAPRVDNSKQFEELNKKLDRIIALLTPRTEPVVVEEVVEVKPEKPVKTPKVKKASVKKVPEAVNE